MSYVIITYLINWHGKLYSNIYHVSHFDKIVFLSNIFWYSHEKIRKIIQYFKSNILLSHINKKSHKKLINKIHCYVRWKTIVLKTFRGLNNYLINRHQNCIIPFFLIFIMGDIIVQRDTSITFRLA